MEINGVRYEYDFSALIKEASPEKVKEEDPKKSLKGKKHSADIGTT
jgi:hypothetical protein